MSLLRFSADHTTSGGQPLFWGRVRDGYDDLPFRGPAPFYTEDEQEARVVTVREFRWAFFDVAVPAEGELFRRVMDACGAGWFQLAHIERFHAGTARHYVEWFECFRQDGRPAASTPVTVELDRGQPSFDPVAAPPGQGG